ncbi:MAG: DEAD/DEAH box helicase [Betaproteobacteria bacterium]|nr:MAG: DEAD/DEAH box helicase [Betaproteobacteria bacterium]
MRAFRGIPESQLISSGFDSLGLIAPLVQVVRELGYEQPTPVQEQAIPLVLQGRDLMAGAQTGTGKTAAFALPTLQRLAPYASTSASPARHPVRALVLTPTRELAVQVYESFREYARHLPLRCTVVYGGVDMNAQIAELRRGVEILVATPGRLLDHVQNKTVMFNQVSVLTLDEADRMLDMGFMPDIRRILALLPAQRQNLLFSATFPEEIRALAKQLLSNPAEVQVAARNAAAELVTHVLHPVARQKKRELLAYLVQSRGLKQVLVFCGTRIGANRLAHQLRRDHIHADAIHGDKTQAERELALEAFKAGKTTVLVATDVASRGLDIDALPQVINFDIPHSPEDYVHRIGRTGRAGLEGEAISLVSPDDLESLSAIERLIRKRIDRVLVPGFEPDGATVAALMGRDAAAPRREARPRDGEPPQAIAPRHAPRREPRSRDRAPAQASAPRQTPPPRPQRHADPIFSRPYEPSASAPAEAPPQPAGPPSRQRPRPVAALLGGLKRAAG